MIKTMIKGRKIKVVLEKEIQDWFFEMKSPEEIAKRINVDLKEKILEQVVDNVLRYNEFEIEQKAKEIILNSIITEDLINESIRDRIKQRISLNL